MPSTVYFYQERAITYGWEFLIHTVVIAKYLLWKVGILIEELDL